MPWIATLSFLSLVMLSCSDSDPVADVQSAPESVAAHDADPVLAELGEPRFQRYCASCHGVRARGDGPVASSLQVPPPDLRRIAIRRGGAFPGGEISRMVDGRFELAPHGPREMPVWGQAFGSNLPAAGMGESAARGEIAVLVEYLKSIQDSPSDPAHTPEIRRTMGDVFQAMRVLLPLSLSAEGFDDPDDQQRVQDAVDMLDRGSAQLARHGASDDVAFAHLSHSLAIDARDIRLRFDSGHRNEARYLVHTLTETCVACHSRLPGSDAPRSEAFASDIDVVDLPIAKRAKLAYATRQFETALELYETVLASNELPANDIDLGGHLDDYLELAIRVQRDSDRAASALAGFARRQDLSPVLRQEVSAWLTALAKVSNAEAAASPIDAALALIATRDEQSETDRQLLVEHLEASGLLHRALEGPLPQDERAQAYYLLGVIEARIGQTFWLSEAEAYLETAIRLAPGRPVALDAYAQLDEYIVAGYSGSGGEQVPPDVQAKLDQLRWVAETPADQ
jgi:mono/diheme cytochrome c family protein